MKTTLLIFSSIFLNSCLGGSDYYRDRVEPFLKDLKPNYKPQVFDGVMEPAEFPDLDEDQKTSVGIDSNHDGVRDDMEIFINRNFKYDYEREPLKGEFRRAPNLFNNYKKMNKDELIVEMSNDSEELSCINYAYEYLKLPMSPEKKKYRSSESLYNTPQREAILTYISHECTGLAYGDGRGDKKIYPNCIKKIKEKYEVRK